MLFKLPLLLSRIARGILRQAAVDAFAGEGQRAPSGPMEWPVTPRTGPAEEAKMQVPNKDHAREPHDGRRQVRFQREADWHDQEGTYERCRQKTCDSNPK